MDYRLKFSGEKIDELLTQVDEGDGYYPQMSVGFADNLVGRGEATAEQFAYRPTASGLSVMDGAARITKIKGNSVVWNNMITNSFGYNGYYVTKHDDGSYTVQNNESVTSGRYISHWWSEYAIVGHKYLFWGLYETSNISSSSDYAYFAIYNLNISGGAQPLGKREYANTIGVASCIAKCVSTSTSRISFAPFAYGNCVVTIKKYIGVDLTKAFGAGNEPATVEEFFERVVSGIDIFEQNNGKLYDSHISAIETTGLNQFNGTYARVIGGEEYYLGGTYTSIGFTTELGGATETITISSDKLYTPLQSGYIYATGTDICINLSHTGYKNGTYEPYRTFRKDLSWMSKYFPDGMRRAGSIYDSIEWDSSKQKWVAVQRVGAVDLGNLAWSYNATYKLFSTKISDGVEKSKVGITSEKYPYNGSVLGASGTTFLDKSIYNYYNTNNLQGLLYFYILDSEYTDATSFKSAMQGVLMNYELATPVITEIEEENLNFDYDVADFGTEEALSSVPSAPFSTDIIYEFNATDRVRQNTLAIEELRTMLSLLQTQMASLQTANVNVE